MIDCFVDFVVCMCMCVPACYCSVLRGELCPLTFMWNIMGKAEHKCRLLLRRASRSCISVTTVSNGQLPKSSAWMRILLLDGVDDGTNQCETSRDVFSIRCALACLTTTFIVPCSCHVHVMFDACSVYWIVCLSTDVLMC